MRRARFLLTLPCAGLAMGLLSACNPATPYAAIVNGHRVSQAQLSRELKAFGGNAAFVTEYDQSAASQQPARPGILATGTAHTTYTQSFAATVLNLDIQSVVIHDEVMRRRIEPASGAIDAQATATAAAQQFGNDPTGKPVFDGFSPWLRHLFQVRQAEEDALNKVLPQPPPVNAAAVQQFYNANPQDFISNECVSHILVATQADANAVAAKLAGGADFATVAAASSIDTATAGKGGDLGCQAPGTGTNPVEQDQTWVQASSTAPLGRVSAPTQISSGWDIFKVTSRTQQPLDATVTQEIQAQLQQQQTSAISQFFQQASATLKVTINPEYGSWDSQQFVINPPTTPDPTRSGLPVSPTTVPPVSPSPPVSLTPGSTPAGSTPGSAPAGSTPGSTPPVSTPPASGASSTTAP